MTYTTMKLRAVLSIELTYNGGSKRFDAVASRPICFSVYCCGSPKYAGPENNGLKRTK